MNVRLSSLIRTVALAGGVLIAAAPGVRAGALPDCLPGADANAGKAVYQGTCQVCHGTDGKGAIPGVPDLTAENGRLKKSNDELVGHVKNGFSDSSSPLAMPPKGGNPALSDQDVRNVVAYLHRNIHRHHHCK